jgi:hypothetical protein
MRAKQVGPRAPTVTPEGRDGQALEIVYGHNLEARRLILQLSHRVGAILLSADEARQMAAQLIMRADLIDGKQVH